MEAIIYTTNTGSAEQYAKMLAEQTGLPVFSMEEAKSEVEEGSEIIYLGWIMAAQVKGYKTAAKKYKIRAVCAVGMEKTGTRTEQIRKKTFVPAEVPLFTLQGNFNVKKLHGFYRLMMSMMVKMVTKQLVAKTDRTQRENEMLEIMLQGGENVRKENLAEVLDWYKREQML
ncbi:MAG: flavodoxin domain-containing protein [Treponema berlinense]|uniref:flavodoxin domain-containing protein n=1 Tax=Treponema berlinense TaxID=225004 RepID=UPI0023F79513|nr:flavodoxin domain-containing protein [Treponema berlinense]MDY3707170.1 flavodoxin domain-containing protein [Treponema berlinense]